VESSGFEWWPSGARVSCTLTASQPPILPSSSSQRIACFRYWTFVNRTTVDATWCHKIKSSAPWIFSLFFIYLSTLCACWLCWFGCMIISLIFYSYTSRSSGIGKMCASIWLAIFQPSAFTFRSKIIHFSFAHAKMCSNFHKKKNHHKTLTKANKKNPAIWNHLNNANWRLFLNALQSDVSSSKFKPHQSNSDLNFKFVELSQLSNEMILNYKQTFSAHFRWVQ